MFPYTGGWCCTLKRFHILVGDAAPVNVSICWVMSHPSTFPYTCDIAPLNFSIYWWVM
jgi:hypothetical protein